MGAAANVRELEALNLGRPNCIECCVHQASAHSEQTEAYEKNMEVEEHALESNAELSEKGRQHIELTYSSSINLNILIPTNVEGFHPCATPLARVM